MKFLRPESVIYKALLLIFYSVPYAFLCVNTDAKQGSMAFYLVAAAAIALLCRTALKTKNIPILYIGNLLSFLFSFVAIKLSDLECMGWYFKPFTVYSLVLFISLSTLVIQTVAVFVYVKSCAKDKEGDA